MPTDQFKRLFSRSEADELVPTLELLVRDLQNSAKALRGSITELCRSDPEAETLDLGKLCKRYPQLRENAAKLSGIIERIEDLGCFLKDIDLGLIDIPSESIEGKIVFLCWQSGETAMVAWHAIDAGFAQRQALPGVSDQYLN